MSLFQARAHLALHVLQESHFVQGSGATGDIHIRAQGVAVRGVDRPLLVDLIRLADMLGRHIRPLFGQIDHRARVHQTVAEFVGDLSLNAVQYPAGFVAQRVGSRGEHHQVLHISPRKAGIRLEGEGGDAGGQRRRGGCTGVLHRADVIGTQLRVHVHGGDALVVAGRARRIRGRQGGAALLEIPRLVAALGRARYRQREDAVRVAVAVARVGVSTAVARRPHEDRALALATLREKERDLSHVSPDGKIKRATKRWDVTWMAS